MTIRPIITAPDPLLKQVSTPVEAVTDDTRALMDDMLETMYDAPGIGLAAIQIGVPQRILVIDLQDRDLGEDEDPGDQNRNPMFFVNPEIIWHSEELTTYQEGCLSVPEFFEDVDRPAAIKARYIDYNGDEQILETDGLLATCLQHEMDHLNGILFVDHLSRLKRSMIIKKLKKQKSMSAA